VFFISLTEKGKRVATILDSIRKEFAIKDPNLHGYNFYN